MKAIDLIQNDVPPIKIDESLEKALNWMDEFKVNHLPVVSGSEFVGLISDDMIYDFNNSKEIISKINFIGKQQFVFGNAHLFQIMLLLSNYNLSVISVCDNQNNYKATQEMSKKRQKKSSIDSNRRSSRL